MMERRAAILAVFSTMINAMRGTAAQLSGTGRLLYLPMRLPESMTILIGAPDFKYVYTDGTRRVSVTVAEILDALEKK